MLKWHREYMEGKLALTPLKLLCLADEESQILKHSNQWVETIDPSISTLQAFVTKKATTSNDLLCTLTANLGFHTHSRPTRTTPPSMLMTALSGGALRVAASMMLHLTSPHCVTTTAGTGIFAPSAAPSAGAMGIGSAHTVMTLTRTITPWPLRIPRLWKQIL
jgi:hypothetical protein